MSRLARVLVCLPLCALVATPALPQQRLDAELKGITVVGLVVEDLSAAAAACGLTRETIQTMAARSLAEGGLKVVRDSDQDTYVYVNVNTTSAPGGLCVSRYDAFLYTHTMAKLSYQTTPVLVQVSLIHEAGLGGGSPGGHGDAIVKSLKAYIDQFASRIRKANQ
jgi:hypothetical protein